MLELCASLSFSVTVGPKAHVYLRARHTEIQLVTVAQCCALRPYVYGSVPTRPVCVLCMGLCHGSHARPRHGGRCSVCRSTGTHALASRTSCRDGGSHPPTHGTAQDGVRCVGVCATGTHSGGTRPWTAVRAPSLESFPTSTHTNEKRSEATYLCCLRMWRLSVCCRSVRCSTRCISTSQDGALSKPDEKGDAFFGSASPALSPSVCRL